MYKYKLNEAAFMQNTEHCQYWLGFLLADATIRVRPHYHTYSTLRVNLNPKDEEHLIKLSTFLETERPLTYYEQVRKGTLTKRVILTVDSIPLVTSLVKHGISPRKSLTAVAPEHLGHSIPFWRGVVDGDGHLSINRRGYPLFELVGTETLIDQWATFITRQDPGVYSPRRVAGKVWRIRSRGNHAVSIARILYTNASVYLDRKKLRADQILKMI